MELRRQGWGGRTYTLFDDATQLATVQLAMVREAGEITLADGRRLTVRRQAGFGPWEATDDQGGIVATATKTEFMRDRLDIDWPGGRWSLARRFAMGMRLEVSNGSGAVVGEVTQSGVMGRTYHLDLPDAPVEVAALTAWIVALLVQRDDSSAG